MKNCSKCGITKEFSDFRREKRASDGLKSWCRSCEREYNKKWAEQNKGKCREYSRKHRKVPIKLKVKLECVVCGSGFEQTSKRLAKYCSDICRNKRRNQGIKGVKCNCVVCGGEFERQNQKHQLCSYKCRAEFSKRNAPSLKYKEKKCKTCKELFMPKFQKHVFCSRKCQNVVHRKKANLSPFHKLNKNFARTISAGLLNGKGGVSWQKMLGYNIQDLIKHLESKFHKCPKTGRMMSWENYGKKGWHIDHIIPQHYFAYLKRTDKQFKICWSLDNLQPLWEHENCSKNKQIRQEDISNAKRFMTVWTTWYDETKGYNFNYEESFKNKEPAGIYYIDRDGYQHEIGESAFLEELRERVNGDIPFVNKYLKSVNDN